MDGAADYTAQDGTFAIRVPAGWQTEPDTEEGGVDLWHPDGAGDLHLLGFPAPSGAEAPDPAEELYAFLEENDIELEEDEVEDVELPSGAEMALCEYVTEDEESGEATFWMVAVAVLPESLVFAHYTCPLGQEEAERDQVRALLQTLRAPGGEERAAG
jgi:hypothetical protein